MKCHKNIFHNKLIIENFGSPFYHEKLAPNQNDNLRYGKLEILKNACVTDYKEGKQ